MPDLEVRPVSYRAQEPLTLEPLPDKAGFIVLLNEGTTPAGERSLVRAFVVEPHYCPRGVTFTPTSDGLMVIDVDKGLEMPDGHVLEAFLKTQAFLNDDYADPRPGILRPKP